MEYIVVCHDPVLLEALCAFADALGPHCPIRATRGGANSIAAVAAFTHDHQAWFRLWLPFVLREGSQGLQAVLCVALRVVARRGLFPGPDVWLLLLRRNAATDELKCCLCHGPADLPAVRLVWLAGLRWPIEQCFRDGKQLFGLSDYERGLQLAGLAPPSHARHADPLLRGEGDVRLSQKRPGLTVPQTCLLVDVVLSRIGSPADRALAIVDYRWARNAAAHHAHAQRRRRYCAYLLRQCEVSLHY